MMMTKTVRFAVVLACSCGYARGHPDERLFDAVESLPSGHETVRRGKADDVPAVPGTGAARRRGCARYR